MTNSPPSYDNENEAAPSYDMDDNKAYQLDKKDALRDYEGVGDSAVGREDGQTSKQGRSSDVQSVSSAAYASSSSAPLSFREKASAYKKQLSGKILSKDEDVAYGRTLLNGGTREEALEASNDAKRAQQLKFDEGVDEAREWGKTHNKHFGDPVIWGAISMK